MSKKLQNTIRTLITIMETKDENLKGHSIHIEKLCLLSYDFLPFHMRRGISPDDLSLAALFHDLGQVGVPGESLGKAGKLSEEERKQLRQHPELSMELLKEMGGYEKILEWVKYHHERVDGKGYYGLKGNEIPVASRILAVADAFSSITMLKSYKPSGSYEDGMSILRMEAGTQFDEKIVEIFDMIPRNRMEECAKQAREEADRIRSMILPANKLRFL